MSAVIKAIGHHDSCMYFGSIAKAAVTEDKMDSLGWMWVKPGAFHAHCEGPLFAFRYRCRHGRRYNIRPWKKANGTYVWRCHHPAFKEGDELLEFLDPVSCAVAQEVAG